MDQKILSLFNDFCRNVEINFIQDRILNGHVGKEDAYIKAKIECELLRAVIAGEYESAAMYAGILWTLKKMEK